MVWQAGPPVSWETVKSGTSIHVEAESQKTLAKNPVL